MTQHSIVYKITENNVLDVVESIFGADVGKQPIPELLKEMQNTTNTSIGIKNDCANILRYAINTGETGKIRVNDIIDVLTSIKEVDQKRKWLSNNNINLLESFGKHYKGEDTDWDNVKNSIDVVEQIIEYFGKKQIPNKLINYLISCENSQDSFAVFV